MKSQNSYYRGIPVSGIFYIIGPTGLKLEIHTDEKHKVKRYTLIRQKISVRETTDS